MHMCSLVISRYNLKSTLNIIKCVNRELLGHKCYIVRRFSNMAQKVSKSNSYIAVNVPEIKTTSNKKSWFSFRRKSVKEKKIPIENAKPLLKKAEIYRLFTLAKPEKYKLIGAIGLLVVSSTVSMAVPFSIGRVLDIIYTNSDHVDEARRKLNQLGLILLSVFVLGAVCNFGRVYIMSASGYRMTQTLRKDVFNAIIKQEQGWFDKRSTGELVNRLSSDSQIVGQALSQNISDGLRSCAMVLAGTGMMFYMSYELALVGLAVVPPVACVAVIYGRYVRSITQKVQDSLADATKIAEERIGSIRTVKTFAKEFREMKSYAESTDNILQFAYKETGARALFYGLTGLTGNLIIISVLYYGGVMVSSHSISVGQLSSFLLYAAYIGISVGGLSSFYSELNKSVGAAKRLWEIIDREAQIPITGGFIPMTLPQGKIDFQNIKFAYPSREDSQIFDNLNLEIAPGQMVAVVGSSGSGKSTLGALLLRLYDPLEGSVLLDDFDIANLDPSWLRKHIGAVSQEPILFSTTIRENILYGSDEPETVSDDELFRVAKEANVHEFVQQLPDGYETLVGERGVMLSGGQKQRVAIARALIKDPKILLLDEATSALDAQSEHLVQEALEKVMQGRTVLTIAHRLSTIQNADLIAVLKDGKIVEKGTYRDLLNLENGVFKELMKHQTFQDVKNVVSEATVT